MTIRPIQPDDARELASLLYETWLVTYPNDDLGITKGDIQEFFKDRITDEGIEKRRKLLESIHQNEKFLVAEESGRIIGCARLIKRDEFDHFRRYMSFLIIRAKVLAQDFLIHSSPT